VPTRENPPAAAINFDARTSAAGVPASENAPGDATNVRARFMATAVPARENAAGTAAILRAAFSPAAVPASEKVPAAAARVYDWVRYIVTAVPTIEQDPATAAVLRVVFSAAAVPDSEYDVVPATTENAFGRSATAKACFVVAVADASRTAFMTPVAPEPVQMYEQTSHAKSEVVLQLSSSSTHPVVGVVGFAKLLLALTE
jgi:hypothetical protein